MMSQTMTLTQDDDASVVLMERRLSRKISGCFLAPVLGRTDVYVSFPGVVSSNKEIQVYKYDVE